MQDYHYRDHLKNRIYYAAKDGMSIALYTLLVGANKHEVEAILDEVKLFVSGLLV